MFEVMTLVNKIIDRKGVEQPSANTSALYFVCVGDTVNLTDRAVAHDVNVKQILDGILISVECSLRNPVFMILIQRGTRPSPVNLFSSYAATAVDHIYKPDIFFEKS